MGKVRKPSSRLDGIAPYDPKYLPAEVSVSANESPYAVPEEVGRAISERLGALDLNRYPDPLASELRQMIAQANGLEPGNVMIGNGGDELLFNLALAWGGPQRTFLNFPPTFSVYEMNARLTGTDVVNVPRKEGFAIDEDAALARIARGDIDFTVVTSPNNPSGDIASQEFIVSMLKASDALVLVDEAYSEYARTSMLPYLKQYDNLAILRTFSKAYRLAGVRIGYLLASEEVITQFTKVRQPYSVDAMAQSVACAVFENRVLFEPAIDEAIEQRGWLYDELNAIPGITAFPSHANYLLFEVPDAGSVWDALYARGVLVRDFSRTPGLEGMLRVSVGAPYENRAFIEALRSIVEERSDA